MENGTEIESGQDNREKQEEGREPGDLCESKPLSLKNKSMAQNQ